MTLIDRDIVKMFLGSYVILLLTGIGTLIFFDVIVNLDEFTEDPNLSMFGVLQRIADYHGYRLPLYFHQFGGVMMAMAASYTIAIMLRNNELTPLVAAGVPLQRLAVPILVCATLLVGGWLINAEYIMPPLAHKIARHYDDLGQEGNKPVRCVRDDENAILLASELNAARGQLRQVFIIEPDAEGDPSYLIQADAATYNPERDTWELQRGARLTTSLAGGSSPLGSTLRREPIAEYPFGLKPEQILLRQSSQWADMMAIRQMNTLLQSESLPNLPKIAKSRDIRFTQPLLIWILILLTLPFFLTREPTDVLAAGGKAIVAGGACFGCAFLAHSVSTEPYLAQLVVWSPVLAFGPLAILLLANVKT